MGKTSFPTKNEKLLTGTHVQLSDRFLRSRLARFSETVQEFVQGLLEQLISNNGEAAIPCSDDELTAVLMQAALVVDMEDIHLCCEALAALPGCGQLALMSIALDNSHIADEAYESLAAEALRYASDPSQLLEWLEKYPRLLVPQVADFVFGVIENHGPCALRGWLPGLMSLPPVLQQPGSASLGTNLEHIAVALHQIARLTGTSVAFALPRLAPLRHGDIWLSLLDCSNPDLDQELTYYLQHGSPAQIVHAAERIRDLEREALIPELRRTLATQASPDAQLAIGLALVELGCEPDFTGSSVPPSWPTALARAQGPKATALLHQASASMAADAGADQMVDTACELAWTKELERWPSLKSLLDTLPPSQALTVLSSAPLASWAASDSVLTELMSRLLNEAPAAEALEALSSPELTTRELAHSLSPWMSDDDASRRALAYRVCAPHGVSAQIDRLCSDLTHHHAPLRYAAIYALRCLRPESGQEALEHRYWQIEDAAEQAALANALAYYRASTSATVLIDNVLRGGTSLEVFPSSPIVLFGPSLYQEPVVQALRAAVAAGSYTHETFSSLIELASHLPPSRAREILVEFRSADYLMGKDDVQLALALVQNGAQDAWTNEALSETTSERFYTWVPGRLWTWAQRINHPSLVRAAVAMLESAEGPSAVLEEVATYLISVEHPIPAVKGWVCEYETKLVCRVLDMMAERPDLFTKTDLDALSNCIAPTPYWRRQLELSRARAFRAFGDPSRFLVLVPTLIESIGRAPYALDLYFDPGEMPASDTLDQILLRLIKRLPVSGDPNVYKLQTSAIQRLVTLGTDSISAALEDALPRLSIHGPLDVASRAVKVKAPLYPRDGQG